MSKKEIETQGWVEEGEEPERTIPLKCPKCGAKVHVVDASRLCGLIAAYCTANNLHWGMLINVKTGEIH
jgi:hypothetical protein